jgi:hypothetical protein
MRIVFRIIFFLLVLFHPVAPCHAAPVPPIVDTSRVIPVEISPETEKAVFADKAYVYKEAELKRGRNFIQEFLDWLFSNDKDDDEREAEQSADMSSSSRSFWDGRFMGNLILILCIGAILGGLVYLIVTGKWRTMLTPKPAETPFDFKEITEDIEGLNIDKLIEEARLRGDFRLATRWWYLKILKKFTVCGIIDWKPHKTNFEYYSELQNTEYITAFRQASHVYEHVWYGEMPVTEEMYMKYTPQLSEMEKSIHA